MTQLIHHYITYNFSVAKLKFDAYELLSEKDEDAWRLNAETLMETTATWLKSLIPTIPGAIRFDPGFDSKVPVLELCEVDGTIENVDGFAAFSLSFFTEVHMTPDVLSALDQMVLEYIKHDQPTLEVLNRVLETKEATTSYTTVQLTKA